jgi:hypothetical protein
MPTTGVPMRGSVLAACAAALGLAAVLSACGSSQRLYTPIRSVPIPAGYQRIGGVAQGVYLAVPKSWVVVDLASQTGLQAFMTLLQKTNDSEAISEFEFFATPLESVHGVYATDIHSTAFATSVSAYCTASGSNKSGRAGLPLLRRGSSDLPHGVQNVRRTDVWVGAVPGQELTYSDSNPAVGTMYGAQLEALPSPGRFCVINLYAMGALPAGMLSKIARTVQYP